MAIDGSGGAPAEPTRFISSDPSAVPPAPVWQPGVIEVEFREDIRPQLATGAGEPTAIASPAGVDLTPLNSLLRRYALQRAEPSFVTSTQEAADLAQAVGRQRGQEVPHYGNFVTLYFPATADLRQISQELNQLPEVARAVPVPTALPPRVSVPDPLVGSSDQVVVDPASGLENQWYIFRCHVDQAWRESVGNNVVIADVDWGYRVGHQDLAAQLDLTHAYNAFDGGTNVSTGGSVFHGSGVTGIAGAANNGVGITGIAFGASVWPIQADSGPGPFLGGNAWARAIEWVRTADSGGRRKVLILEVQTGNFGNYEMVPSVNAAIRAAIASGVVVCVAAGNGNRDASIDDANNPIPDTGSILVGATAYDPATNPRAWFSNFGSRIVVSAPGDSSHDLTCDSASDSAYRNGFGGTSGATPKVAATAALMLSVNPLLGHADIRSILNSTGGPITTDPAKPVGKFLNSQAAVDEAQLRAGAAVFLRGTPASFRDAAGRIQLFVRGRPNAMLSDIFERSQVAPNNGWGSWIHHGHGFEDASPAVAINADGRLELFASGSTGMQHSWQTSPGGAWSAWAALLSEPSGSPAAARNADGRLEVFAVTFDGALKHIWQTSPNNGWSGVDSLGGSYTFPFITPAVAASADGRLEVFAISPGPGGALQHIWQLPGGGWSGWYTHAGAAIRAWGAPGVAANADGRLEVFVLGDDNALHHIWQTVPSGGWSAWDNLGGPTLDSQPSVARNADGRLEVFAIATDGTMHHISQTTPNGGWSSWSALGGAGGGFDVWGAPGAVSNADGRLEVFAIGADSDLYHAWQTAPGGGWSSWAAFGRPTL